MDQTPDEAAEQELLERLRERHERSPSEPERAFGSAREVLGYLTAETDQIIASVRGHAAER